MPVLLPFRALLLSPQAGPLQNWISVPGEDPAPLFPPAFLRQETSTALFVYRQQFRFPGEQEEHERIGVMGLLNRTENTPVFRHECTRADSVLACAEERQQTGMEASSLFLWCNDEQSSLAPAFSVSGAPLREATDRHGCLHQIWRVTEQNRITAIQQALQNQPLFLADGHHRFAAGWQLATIQIRTPALRSLPAHRLVLEPRDLRLPPLVPVENYPAFFAAAPRGKVRFGVLMPDAPPLGFEVPCREGERNITVLHREVLRNALVKPVRTAVRTTTEMMILVEPLSVDAMEADARGGILLPPKSTDFYPKLAAGLVMHRHQKENFTPPTPQKPGVRNPSS